MRGLRETIFNAVGVGFVVLAGALFGIFTRPVGFLATFWPINALLLGLMIRAPRLARPFCWLAAFAGFMLADGA